MTDRKPDSVLVGWADDPQFNDNNELMSWRLKLKDHELQEMLDKYLTQKSERGGGNVYLTMFMSRSGKACCRVYDPNSEGAKEARERKAAANVANALPF